MSKFLLAGLAIAGLAACDGKPLTWHETPIGWQRQYAADFQDQPFDEGAVSVVTAEHGEMQTYRLTPCRGGTHVCGTAAGHLVVTPDYAVVTGAYAHRTFYLSPGGDGWMKRGGHLYQLAWNE